ncbi:hypothetical protein H2203_004967 [Taxawa tesnikishii (nom. ined.)]|nr:hypothetical protein H2203_004967 [Dothideales sp. JES 119]
MPTSRKRKASSDIVSSAKQIQTSKNQKSIQDFGRVGKAQQLDQSVKKRKVVVGIPSKGPEPGISNNAPSNGAKRLAKEVNETAPSHQTAEKPKAHSEYIPTETSRKKRQRDGDVATPQNKRFKNAFLPSPAETPTKGARNLFDKLNLAAPGEKAPVTPSKDKEAYETPPLTPRSFKNLPDIDITENLPIALKDLISLFSSFLSAVSLFYAHNGASSQSHLRTIAPLVTKHWKKRTVTETDIRRVLRVLGPSKPIFSIVSYGKNDLRLEPTEETFVRFNQLDQKGLDRRFQDRLCNEWRHWQARNNEGADVLDFVQQLPLLEVEESETARQLAAAPSKGQRRLDLLRDTAQQARQQTTEAQKPSVAPVMKTAEAVSSRGSSLLDRILAKQQFKSSQPNGPTKEELERKAALHRIEEVAMVLDMLAAGRPRVSFGAQTLVKQLQNSLRNPISIEEAERCIGLMAEEVAPRFVGVIQTGDVRGVVITKAGRPTTVELRARLQGAGA